MLSFHNNPLIKEKYLMHRKLDNIRQAIGWKNDKGCAVGCTLENYDYSRYPIELGIPVWLAILEGAIFNNLPDNEAMKWRELFLKSIPVGVYLEPVKHKISIKRMNRLLVIQNNLLKEKPYLSEVFIKTINTIELVKKYHQSKLNKEYFDRSEIDSLEYLSEYLSSNPAENPASRSAIWSVKSTETSAKESSESAVWSAAWSETESAKSEARSASWSAESAADSAAESAGWSAAWSSAWKQEADNLIEILKESK